MVCHFPRLFGAPDKIVSRPEKPAVEGFGERVLDRISEAFCGLHGHESLLQFEHDRLYLKCASCGHESPGWLLNEPPPGVEKVDSRPRALVRPQLIGARRIA